MPGRRRTLPELVLLPDEQNPGGRQSAGEVPEVDDRPVASDLARPHPPARPCHHDEVVAGEELGAGDDDEDQAEREREPAEEAQDSERDVGTPAVTVVAKIAPSAMKAPASTESANVFAVDMPALTTPTCSALRAISTGGAHRGRQG